MAKKNGGFGKLIAFTTAVAAIGGVCYIFRDKIKDSSLFKSASGKQIHTLDIEELKKNIEEHNITQQLLLEDDFSQWAVTTPLYNIGEQVYNLSYDFKKSNSQIPWNLVSGLRHRLVHDYEGINWSIIVDVVFNEMDDFVLSIKESTSLTVGK